MSDPRGLQEAGEESRSAAPERPPSRAPEPAPVFSTSLTGSKPYVQGQEVVARLSMIALSCRDLQQLFDEACRSVSETLSVEYCGVLELMPEEDVLLLRAGVGWAGGYVSQATVGANHESQAGYTLLSGDFTVVEYSKREPRFKDSPLFHDHGVASGITIVIRAGESSFGILGAYTREERVFAEHDILFLENVANLLGVATGSRQKEDQLLKAASEQSDRVEAAELRFELLAESNALLLASSTDYKMTLRNTVRLAVPGLADWCFVDIIEPGGGILRTAVGRADETSGSSAHISEELKWKHPMNPNLLHGLPKVLKTGRPELLTEVGDIVLGSIATDPEHLEFLRSLAPDSYMCVPLRTRRGVGGVVGFVSNGSGRRYSEEDLTLAEGIAHCAALALDNAASHLPKIESLREINPLSGTAGDKAATVVAHNRNVHDLTRRQLEVLGLMAEGKTARQIGKHLHIAEDTVRNHIRAVKDALDASSQLEAIAQARKLGMLPG